MTAKVSTVAVEPRRLSGAERAGLEGCEDRSTDRGSHVGIQLALKKLPHEDRQAAFDPDIHHVADQRAHKARCQLGCIVANLVGVRKKNELRLCGSDELLERSRVAVCRVVGEQLMIERRGLWRIPMPQPAAPALRCRVRAPRLPEAHPSAEAILLPPATVSNDIRLNEPARCSRTTRTLIGPSLQTSASRLTERLPDQEGR